MTLAFIATCILASLSLAQNPPAGGRRPVPKLKNIRVLKNVPPDQIIPIMHKINDSLGVRCDFCHEVKTGPGGQHEGWELDTKPMKNVARQMITMTYDINKRYRVADKKVTCFTCHHGHAEPESNPEGGRPGRR
jgi:hypothetical protein